jgi:hypothetical protein
MSIYIQPNLFVRIEQLTGDRAPQPLPLASGFSSDRIYEILGIHTASESAEAYLILRNDRDEMWFISNRHCRLVDRKFNLEEAHKTHTNGSRRRVAEYRPFEK